MERDAGADGTEAVAALAGDQSSRSISRTTPCSRTMRSSPAQHSGHRHPRRRNKLSTYRQPSAFASVLVRLQADPLHLTLSRFVVIGGASPPSRSSLHGPPAWFAASS